LAASEVQESMRKDDLSAHEIWFYSNELFFAVMET